MIWKVLIGVLTADLFYRAVKYGPYELHALVSFLHRKKK